MSAETIYDTIPAQELPANIEERISGVYADSWTESVKLTYSYGLCTTLSKCRIRANTIFLPTGRGPAHRLDVVRVDCEMASHLCIR